MAVTSFLDTSWVSAAKVLAFLQNMLEIASSFNTEWESEFGKQLPQSVKPFRSNCHKSWLIRQGLRL